MKNKDDLADLLDLDVNELNEYKFHPAIYNGSKHPLDDYNKDRAGIGEVGDKWLSWQTSYGSTNRWTLKYILSFMRVHPEGKDTWLFGGIFEVIERKKKEYYKVKLTDRGKEYIGRLKITYHHSFSQQYPYLETVYGELKLSEILKVPYYQLGKPFDGYENISLDFTELESIIEISREDWRRALYNIKGIYVIFDKHTGKKYVGSASGEGGIWNRWCDYVHSLDGNNKEFKKIKAGFKENKEEDMYKIWASEGFSGYVRDNFRFTLLECWANHPNVIDRENFWKEALLSRVKSYEKYGYNAN